jgi:DNA-damage-inducible protein J
MASSMVHIRVDGEVKEQAAEALATMGLTVSDAVRILRCGFQTARPWRP